MLSAPNFKICRLSAAAPTSVRSFSRRLKGRRRSPFPGDLQNRHQAVVSECSIKDSITVADSVNQPTPVKIAFENIPEIITENCHAPSSFYIYEICLTFLMGTLSSRMQIQQRNLAGSTGSIFKSSSATVSTELQISVDMHLMHQAKMTFLSRK